MTLYADTSALLKRYVDEPDSERAVELLASDAEVVTGRHTVVEVRRNLARLLPSTAASAARGAFAMTFLTFDARQAQAARALGFAVAGM